MAAGPEIDDRPKVPYGALNLFVGVLGHLGWHMRYDIGASCLPFNEADEIEAVLDVAKKD